MKFTELVNGKVVVRVSGRGERRKFLLIPEMHDDGVGWTGRRTHTSEENFEVVKFSPAKCSSWGNCAG